MRIHQQNCRDPEVPAQSQICIRHHQGLEHTPASNSQVSFIYTVQDIKIILNYGRNYEVTGWIKIPPWHCVCDGGRGTICFHFSSVLFKLIFIQAFWKRSAGTAGSVCFGLKITTFCAVTRTRELVQLLLTCKWLDYILTVGWRGATPLS